MEDHLAAVAVARPLVKDEGSQENGGEILYAAQKAIGEEIRHQGLAGDAREARAELKPRPDRFAAFPNLKRQLGIAAQQSSGHFHEGGGRDGQANKPRQARGQHLVGEHARVLGVILEFYDVASRRLRSGPTKAAMRRAYGEQTPGHEPAGVTSPPAGFAAGKSRRGPSPSPEHTSGPSGRHAPRTRVTFARTRPLHGRGLLR